MKRIVLAVALGFFVPDPSALAAQDPIDTCALLPGQPDVKKTFAERPNAPKGLCVGLYWQRVQRPHFFAIGEFDAIIRIIPAASIAEARKGVEFKPGTTRTRPLPLGDGGTERAERPGAGDEPPPHPQEVATNTRHHTMEELLDPSNWSAAFTCGALMVFGYANPTKALATRELLVDLDAKLKAAGLCSGAAPAIAANPAPDPPPLRPVADVEPGGVRTFDGETAREISNADASGARYMVVLSRDWDAQQNCWVERRAWAGGIRGSDATRVTVQLGPVKTVCVGGAVVSAAEVNQAQRGIAEARNNLATALKQQESYEAIMKNDSNPDHVRAAAAARHAGVQQWIDYYKKRIRELEIAIVQSVPD